MANNCFHETKEYQQSLRMRDACNRVLCSVFDVGINDIKRYERDNDLFILDKEFHIDVLIKLKNGSQITGQEKALSYEFYKFKTFTIEFYQNAHTKEPGEFFTIASQFYLHGYSDKTGIEFAEWHILDVLLFMDWLRNKNIVELENKTRRACGSRASFLYIPYDDIPQEFYLQQHVNWATA